MAQSLLFELPLSRDSFVKQLLWSDEMQAVWKYPDYIRQRCPCWRLYLCWCGDPAPRPFWVVAQKQVFPMEFCLTFENKSYIVLPKHEASETIHGLCSWSLLLEASRYSGCLRSLTLEGRAGMQKVLCFQGWREKIHGFDFLLDQQPLWEVRLEVPVCVLLFSDLIRGVYIAFWMSTERPPSKVMLSMWHPTTSSRHCKGSSVSPQAEFGIVTTCPGGKGGSFRDVASWHLSCSFFLKKSASGEAGRAKDIYFWPGTKTFTYGNTTPFLFLESTFQTENKYFPWELSLKGGNSKAIFYLQVIDFIF